MQSTLSQKTPLWWMLTIFGLSLLYILPESIFNSQLVIASGSDMSDEIRIHSVEFFGRAISGFGASILISDFLIKRKLLCNAVTTLIAFLLITLIVWPTVYFGQKWMIESYLVNNSTAEQRQQAFFSQLLKAGFTKNVINIEGLPNINQSEPSKSEMTFLTLFSSLVYADPKMDDVLHPQYKNIVSNYVKRKMYDDFDDNYLQYKKMRVEINKYYYEYKKSSKKYFDTVNGYEKIANRQWAKVEAQIKKGWTKYNNARQSYIDKSKPLAEQASKDIPTYFRRKGKCRSESCIDRLNNAYNKKILKLGLGYIPPEEWLLEDNRSYFEKNLRCQGRNCSFNINIFGALKEIFGNSEKKELAYTSNPLHYQLIILKKFFKKLEKQSGYPSNIKALSQFRSHSKTSKTIRVNLHKEGILLPKTWRAHQKNKFYDAIRNKIILVSNNKWSETPWKKDINIRPGLSRSRFEMSQGVQNKIKNEIGDDFYVSPMLTNWNDKIFKEKVIDININRQTNKIIKLVESSVTEFEDGHQLEHYGKNAIRSTLVPPISMTLSLILVVLTIIKIPLKAFSIIQTHFSKRNDDKQSRCENSRRNRKVMVGIFFATIVLIFNIPLLFSPSIYTKNDSPVNYFLSQVEERSTSIVSNAVKWALHTQPIVYPFGAFLESKLNIMNNVDKHVEFLKSLDEKVIGKTFSDGSKN